ncbi:hypothetical protein D3C71_2232390 [compost metagenome]
MGFNRILQGCGIHIRIDGVAQIWSAAQLDIDRPAGRGFGVEADFVITAFGQEHVLD